MRFTTNDFRKSPYCNKNFNTQVLKWKLAVSKYSHCTSVYNMKHFLYIRDFMIERLAFQPLWMFAITIVVSGTSTSYFIRIAHKHSFTYRPVLSGWWYIQLCLRTNEAGSTESTHGGIHRRPENLKDLLVRATLNPPERNYEATRQCGRPRCKTCAHIKTGVGFSSAVTGKKFRAPTTANCKTSNVVYFSAVNVINNTWWKWRTLPF